MVDVIENNSSKTTSKGRWRIVFEKRKVMENISDVLSKQDKTKMLESLKDEALKQKLQHFFGKGTYFTVPKKYENINVRPSNFSHRKLSKGMVIIQDDIKNEVILTPDEYKLMVKKMGKENEMKQKYDELGKIVIGMLWEDGRENLLKLGKKYGNDDITIRDKGKLHKMIEELGYPVLPTSMTFPFREDQIDYLKERLSIGKTENGKTTTLRENYSYGRFEIPVIRPDGNVAVLEVAPNFWRLKYGSGRDTYFVRPAL